jgi:DNA-binding PadR family transcriptional regulator
MSNVNKNQILKNWEEIHKQGMLMFWLLTVLQKKAADVDTIQISIQELSQKTFSVTEQSLYRSLRKYLQQGLVDYSLEPSSKGPNKKVWFLTEAGISGYRPWL